MLKKENSHKRTQRKEIKSNEWRVAGSECLRSIRSYFFSSLFALFGLFAFNFSVF